MSYKLLPTRRFEKEIKRLVNKFPSLKFEFKELVATLSDNPELGTSIGSNCYKIRLNISSKGKGKRGGARVITYVYTTGQTLYFLTIYDKSEKADLKPNELKTMVSQLDLGDNP